MNLDSLYFYDRNGNPYNFELNTDSDISFYYGEIYLQPVSISLFDSTNIYILQKNGSNFTFPSLSVGQKLQFKWVENNIPEFFLYDVLNDESTNEPYIHQLDEFIFEDNLNGVKMPFQLNIAFSPSEEMVYEKNLLIYFIDVDGTKTKFAKIKFYGEGLSEDERFRIQLENFGIKFHKNDSLCLKDYNINEAYPDWEDVNNIRKQLIINKEEIFPYVGTYRGLKNFTDILGYRDILDIKEYWKNTNESSEYFNKFVLVSIADMLDDGNIDKVNLLENNKNIKLNKSFTKIGMLALAYSFNKPSGRFDNFGTPILERTTDFSSSEMYFKLHKLKDLIQKQFLPVNVIVKDVIGEWNYFISFKTFVWKDNINITKLNVNHDVWIDILPKESHHQMEDVSTLYKKIYETGLDLPFKYFNSATSGIPKTPDKLDLNLIDDICKSIDDFYISKSPDIFNKIDNSDYIFSDDYQKPIGCPINLSLGLKNLMIQDLNNISFLEFGIEDGQTKPGIVDTTGINYTWDKIKYLDFYEIEWYIKYNTPSNRYDRYEFKIRGNVKQLNKLPQILPYVGYYDVSVKVFDYTGNVSMKYDNNRIYVNPLIPEIAGLFIGDDKFNFQVSNLNNVNIEDFGSSTPLDVKVNKLDMSSENDIYIDSNLIDSNEIYNQLLNTEVYDYSLKKWIGYKNSNNQFIDNYGFGEMKSIRLVDFKDAIIDDLFHIRPADCVLSSDRIAGFYFMNAAMGDIIRIGYDVDFGYNEYVIPDFNNDLDTLIDILNDESDNIIIDMFNFSRYTTYNQEIIKNQNINSLDIIIARSKDISKQPFQYLSFIGDNINGEKYTFNLPSHGHDRTISMVNKLNDLYNLDIDIDLYALNIPDGDIINGEAKNFNYLIDNTYVSIEDENQRGVVPVLYQENHLNISTCKVYKDSFIIPKYKTVFFVINNISGKSKFKWNLIDSKNNSTIMTTRNCAYFVYRFNEVGEYNISVDIIDYNNNEYNRTIENMITVYNKKDYIENIEIRLNDIM